MDNSEIRVRHDGAWVHVFIRDQYFNEDFRLNDSEALVASQLIHAGHVAVTPLYMELGGHLFVSFGPGQILIHQKTQNRQFRVVLPKALLRDILAHCCNREAGEWPYDSSLTEAY